MKLAIKRCLESTQFMTLATTGTDGLWVNPVYFAYDKALNLYFISQPGSRHMHNLVKHPDVAVAIFSTNQDPAGDVLGLQIQAHAAILDDDDAREAHVIYYERSPEVPGIDQAVETYLGSKAAWQFVKLLPTQVSLFDTTEAPARQNFTLEEALHG